jgi:hypothetical protein
MSIRQQGGIFGRNPTFNNVTIDGTLTVDQIVEKTGAAGITLDGVTLKDGNVVLANGKGIDFSATSGTGTSELFDDYEEGNWTPVLTGSTSGTVNLSGVYTKIGNVVTVEVLLNGPIASGALVGSLSITGLPFTVNNFGIGNYFCQSNGLLNIRAATVTGTTGAPFAVLSGTTIKLHNSANFGSTGTLGGSAPTFNATGIPQNGTSIIVIDWVFTYTVA